MNDYKLQIFSWKIIDRRYRASFHSLRSSLFRFLLAGESESQGKFARTHGARAKEERGEGVRRKGKVPFLPCPSSLPLIFCHLCPRVIARLPLVSFAAVFWDVTQRSPQRNGYSHPNNIPFPKLANHGFRSMFENVFAPTWPLETCPIRYLFYLHITWWKVTTHN